MVMWYPSFDETPSDRRGGVVIGNLVIVTLHGGRPSRRLRCRACARVCAYKSERPADGVQHLIYFLVLFYFLSFSFILIILFALFIYFFLLSLLSVDGAVGTHTCRIDFCAKWRRLWQECEGGGGLFFGAVIVTRRRHFALNVLLGSSIKGTWRQESDCHLCLPVTFHLRLCAPHRLGVSLCLTLILLQSCLPRRQHWGGPPRRLDDNQDDNNDLSSKRKRLKTCTQREREARAKIGR